MSKESGIILPGNFQRKKIAASLANQSTDEKIAINKMFQTMIEQYGMQPIAMGAAITLSRDGVITARIIYADPDKASKLCIEMNTYFKIVNTLSKWNATVEPIEVY